MLVSDLLALLNKADPKARVWIKFEGCVGKYIGVTTDATLGEDKAFILGEPLSCCAVHGNGCCGYIEDVEDDSQGS